MFARLTSEQFRRRPFCNFGVGPQGGWDGAGYDWVEPGNHNVAQADVTVLAFVTFDTLVDSPI